MGGADKGLLAWRDTTLAQHAAARLSDAGLPVLVSANRNLERYRSLGLRVTPDRRADFPGPLAALEAGLYAASTTWVMAVPCDTPLFPDELPWRLWAGVVERIPAPGFGPPLAAYARCGDAVHPVFCLLSCSLAGTLTRFLDDGGRRMSEWWQAIGAHSVDFGRARESAFANANTHADYLSLRDRDRAPGSLPC
jgi:molybdopterin-guanine dinucleotide biosynthesis protein A